MHQPSIDPRRPSQKVTLQVAGLHCTNCSLSLEKHLLKVGAHAPTVDYATGRTTFSLSDLDKLDPIIQSIGRLGYTVLSGPKRRVTKSRVDSLHLGTIISGILTFPMLVAMFFPHSPLHNPWLQWALATPVFIMGLIHFGSSALRSLRSGVANMDVLITIGIVAGYISSVVSVMLGLSHETIFFEATSSIVTFVLIGHLLEERAVHKTTSAIESLAALQPNTATRITQSADGLSTRHEHVTVEEISIGDLLQINTGDTIPTDSIIEQGSLSCNEMMISGESLPVDKSKGDRLIGGSIALDGSAVVRACAVGDDTILAGIVRLVQDAQSRKPQIQRIGDAVSAVFVPAVVVISAIVLTIGLLVYDLSYPEALVRALAIAVVACPCAMGLATPTAIMVALGKAATSGVLIRGGDTLERLAAIRSIIFDKTGTLTKGDLQVGEIQTQGGVELNDATAAIIALQRHSSHPIARALTKELSARNTNASGRTFSFSSVTETKGVGIEGTANDGSHYICGGARIRERYGISSPNDIVLVKDGQCIASLSLQDSIRPEAQETIEALRASGFSLGILSGDTQAKVTAVAEPLSIADVFAERLPEDKLSLVRERQAAAPVAYIGDGINDAPTLAEASVGISLSSASDVAVNSAQIVLSGNSLSKLPATLQLARITVRTIKQNLFWAFVYNIVAIPLAACGYISPLTGALLMTFSDVVIVANSLRIKLFKMQ
jgi:Cu+-exporting ATPase